MDTEQMLTVEEAGAVLDIVKEYLLFIEGDLSKAKRRAVGRLISEVQYAIEAQSEPDPNDDQPRPRPWTIVGNDNKI